MSGTQSFNTISCSTVTTWPKCVMVTTLVGGPLTQNSHCSTFTAMRNLMSRNQHHPPVQLLSNLASAFNQGNAHLLVLMAAFTSAASVTALIMGSTHVPRKLKLELRTSAGQAGSSIFHPPLVLACRTIQAHYPSFQICHPSPFP